MIAKGDDIYWVLDEAQKDALLEKGARQLSVIRNHPGTRGAEIHVLHVPPELLEAAPELGPSTDADDSGGDEP